MQSSSQLKGRSSANDPSTPAPISRRISLAGTTRSHLEGCAGGPRRPGCEPPLHLRSLGRIDEYFRLVSPTSPQTGSRIARGLERHAGGGLTNGMVHINNTCHPSSQSIHLELDRQLYSSSHVLPFFTMILDHFSWRYLLAALFAAYLTQLYVRRYVQWTKVNRLGGECPRVKTRFPLCPSPQSLSWTAKS